MNSNWFIALQFKFYASRKTVQIGVLISSFKIKQKKSFHLHEFIFILCDASNFKHFLFARRNLFYFIIGKHFSCVKIQVQIFLLFCVTEKFTTTLILNVERNAVIILCHSIIHTTSCWNFFTSAGVKKGEWVKEKKIRITSRL